MGTRRLTYNEILAKIKRTNKKYKSVVIDHSVTNDIKYYLSRKMDSILEPGGNFLFIILKYQELEKLKYISGLPKNLKQPITELFPKDDNLLSLANMVEELLEENIPINYENIITNLIRANCTLMFRTFNNYKELPQISDYVTITNYILSSIYLLESPLIILKGKTAIYEEKQLQTTKIELPEQLKEILTLQEIKSKSNKPIYALVNQNMLNLYKLDNDIGISLVYVRKVGMFVVPRNNEHIYESDEIPKEILAIIAIVDRNGQIDNELINLPQLMEL